jgi:hypothetical protein
LAIEAEVLLLRLGVRRGRQRRFMPIQVTDSFGVKRTFGHGSSAKSRRDRNPPLLWTFLGVCLDHERTLRQRVRDNMTSRGF